MRGRRGEREQGGEGAGGGRRGEERMERREDGEKKMVDSRLINKIVYDGLCYNYTSLSIHVCIYLC